MKRLDLPAVVFCLAAFTAITNLSILIPVVTDIADEFGVGEARVGQLFTFQAIVAASVALLAAPVVDRYERRSILRVEFAILLVGTVVSAAAPSFAMFALARTIAGVGAAIVMPTSVAIINDLYLDQNLRNRRIGMLMTATALSGVIGLPLLTQIAARTNWRWEIASLCVPLAIILTGTWFLPAGQSVQQIASDERRSTLRAEYSQRYRGVFADRGIVCLLGIPFIIASVIAGVWLYFAAWAEINFNASAGALTILFILAGISELVTANMIQRLLERVSAPRAFVVEALTLGLCLLGVGVVFTSEWSLVPFVILISLAGIGLFFVNTIMVLDARRAATGAVLSLQTTCGQLGFAGGAIIGGAMLAAFDRYTLLYRALGMFMLLAIPLLALSMRSAPLKAPLAAET